MADIRSSKYIPFIPGSVVLRAHSYPSNSINVSSPFIYRTMWSWASKAIGETWCQYLLNCNSCNVDIWVYIRLMFPNMSSKVIYVYCQQMPIMILWEAERARIRNEAFAVHSVRGAAAVPASTEPARRWLRVRQQRGVSGQTRSIYLQNFLELETQTTVSVFWPNGSNSVACSNE